MGFGDVGDALWVTDAILDAERERVTGIREGGGHMTVGTHTQTTDNKAVKKRFRNPAQCLLPSLRRIARHRHRRPHRYPRTPPPSRRRCQPLLRPPPVHIERDHPSSATTMQRRRKVFSAEHAIFQDHPTTTLPWTADRSYSPRVTDYLAHHSSSGSASSSTTPPPGCHAPPPPLPPSTLHPPYSLYDPRRHRLLTHVDILSTGSNEKQLEEVITPTPPTPSVVVKRKLKRGGKGKEKEISTSDMAGSELSRLAPTTKTRSPRKRQEHQPIAPSPLKNDTSHTVASDHPSSQRSRKRKQNWLSLAEADEGVSEVENTITHPVIVNGRINRNAKGRVKRAAAGNTATSASTSEREGSIMSFSPHLETPSELPALDPLPPEVVAGGPSAQEQSQLEHNSESEL